MPTHTQRPKGQKNWYNWKAWQSLRAAHLSKQPLCVFCKREGRTVAGSVVDHIEPHKWRWSLFIDPDNLQTLCKRHHDSDKQIIENGNNPAGAVGDDGWPLQETVPRRNKVKP